MSRPTFDRLPAALAGHAGYLLVVLGKHVARSFSAAVEPLGLRPAHCDILLTLAERGPLAQVEIAETLAIERAYLVSLLDQLEARGLVTRTPDATDRRRHAIVPTALGVTTTAQVAERAREVEDTLLHGLTEGERADLRAVLRMLARDVDDSG